MKNYIVRIYRCEEDRPRSIVGIVEEPRVKDKKAFTSYGELWEILKAGTRGLKGGRKRNKTPEIP